MIDFGRDTLCLDSLRTGRRATGVLRVAQNRYHALITKPGTLRGGRNERNFGLDLEGLVGSVVTDAQRAALPGRVRNEMLKDERVKACEVDVQSENDGVDITWTITIRCETALGPFQLVLGVDEASAKLLDLKAL